jgi:hypothetical protein
VLHGLEIRQHGPDALGRAGSFDLVMNQRHVISTSSRLWSATV